MTYDIGVTGTQHGATSAQLLVAFLMIDKAVIEHGKVRVCQGCCVGFDAEITAAIRRKWEQEEVLICAHPPLNRSKTDVGAIMLSNHICTAADYLTRDRRIVAHGKDLLIGAPRGLRYQRRGSGTWYTLNYAVRENHHENVQVVFGDGHVRSGADAIAGRV
jgi:hypothetical protein